MKELKRKLKVLFFGTFLFMVAIFFATSQGIFKTKKTIVVGAKNCTEQHILGELLSQLIERKTDLKVIRRFNLEGTSICFSALHSKTIDVYFEYTGTAVLHILKETLSNKPLYPYVKEVFSRKFGIIWLDPLGFGNQYALITRKDSPLNKISDLSPKTKFAIDPEFMTREEFRLIKDTYQKKWNPKLLDQVLLYFSLQNKNIDVISGFSTDGRLHGDTFKILEDDKNALPAYDVAPMINKECLEKHPEIRKVCKLLKNQITSEQMRKLNYLVEFEGKDVKELIKEMLDASNY